VTKSDLKNWIVLLLTLTVCFGISSVFWKFSHAEAGQMSEIAVTKVAELLIYILGIISGYILADKRE
jgi:hypothetical protein